MNGLTKKLLIKPGYTILVLNAPEGYENFPGELPEGCKADTEAKGRYKLVHLFARNTADLQNFVQPAVNSLDKDGLLWISYPKGTAKIKTDLSRDKGWEPVYEAGYEGVSLVSVDDTWSAMRFKKAAEPGLRHALSANKKYSFEAEIIKDDKTEGSAVIVPFDVKEAFGSRAVPRVKGTVEGKPFQDSIAHYSGIFYLGINKDFRKAIGKNIGDRVKVEFQQDTSERVVNVPEDLGKLLNENPSAKAIFDKFAFTHRKEYVQWIEDAKKPETRERRLHKAIEMIAGGKKFS